MSHARVLALVAAGVLSPLASAATKNVDLNGDGTTESIVGLSVLSSSPVKVEDKVTNKAVGLGFRFAWASGGPAGFTSSLPPGTATGVGTTWTWTTLSPIYSYTGTTCATDICFTRTDNANITRGPFSVPGRSLSTTGVTTSSASLTSSLITSFSNAVDLPFGTPPAQELFRFTSQVDQIAPGLFRYTDVVTNLTSEDLDYDVAPGPFGCDSTCSNGTREGAEVCDGEDLNGYTCANFGQSGTLACLSNCSDFDLSGCHPSPCGNNIKEPGETCDGSDLGGLTCSSFGGASGALGCQPDCHGFDFSNCAGLCGNGVREGYEDCDGSDLGGYTCGDFGGGAAIGSPSPQTTPPSFSFSAFSAADVCGSASCPVVVNGSASHAVYASHDVLRLTPSGQQLNGSAWYRTTQFVAEGFSTTFQFQFHNPSTGTYADGIAFVVQNQGLGALGGTGQQMGYAGVPNSVAVEFDTYQNSGAPANDPNNNHVAVQSCGTNPNSSDHSSCTYGLINSSLPINLADGAVHTATITYIPPDPDCVLGCNGRIHVFLDNTEVINSFFDMAALSLGGSNHDRAYVGLTSATGFYYETHDILSWSFTPTTAGGTLGCSPDCHFDLSSCTDVCGNGVIDSGEECDGAALGGADCSGHGGGGTVSCSATCTLDYGNCTSEYCGNGVIDYSSSEVCDGEDVGKNDCQSLGGSGGTLHCAPDCQSFDLSECTGLCGNGTREGSEVCDGSDLGGFSCEDFGGGTGTLACQSDCTAFDSSNCHPAGPVACETPQLTGPVPAHSSVTTCKIERHPAKEVTSVVTACGTQIPGGSAACANTSTPGTSGTAELLVPDLDVTIGDVYVSPVSVQVIDPSGDGVAEPGETVQITISLLNSGSSPISNVVGTLVSPPVDLDSDGVQDTVTISSATSAYPDGSCFAGFPGTGVDCTSVPSVPAPCANLVPFVVTYPAGHPGDVSRRFTLNLTYDQGLVGSTTQTSPIVIGVSGARCGNGQIDPGEQCDDGNTAAGDCCSPECQIDPAGSSCADDGDLCTQNVCDGTTTVCGHPPVSCDDGNVCTDDGCEPSHGCTHNPNSVPCEDGSACTTEDVCDQGSCVGGPPPNCDDGNVCTDDGCNPATGCTHTNNTAPCSDGNACTTTDACAGGSCHPGPPRNCDDGNVCTDDSCNPATGCAHQNNTAPCSDGNLCTTGDVCHAGACVGGTPPDCNDGNLCTNDSCNALVGCVNASNGNCGANPKSQGYWKRLCRGPHPSGEALTHFDVDCVNDTCTFATVASVSQLCDRLTPNPQNDKCEQAEAQFMSLSLNLCRGRVVASEPIDSGCGSNTTVGASAAQADALLCSPARTHASCVTAQCESEEVSSGQALWVNNLRIERSDSYGSMLLNWTAPYQGAGSQAPSRYRIWRRTSNDTAFSLIAEIPATATTYTDVKTRNVSFEYEVTVVW